MPNLPLKIENRRPCPWCKQQPKLLHPYLAGNMGWIVLCENSCPVQPQTVAMTTAEAAVAAWNSYEATR